MPIISKIFLVKFNYILIEIVNFVDTQPYIKRGFGSAILYFTLTVVGKN